MRPKSGAAAEVVLDPELLVRKQTTTLEQKVSEIFLLLRRPVHRYLVGLLSDPEEAEDVTQEVFLSLFSCLRKGETVGSVRGWVFKVAHNRAMDRLRKRETSPFLDSNADRWESLSRQKSDTTSPADPEQRLMEQELDSKLHSAWNRLSPQERRCMDLRAEGLRYREIAAALGIRPSSVGNFLARAVMKIVKELHE